MQRISTATAVPDKFGAGKDGFTDGDVIGGIPATDLEAIFFDNLQEEIANVVEGAGIVLNGATLTQLRQAVKRLFGGNVTTVNAANSPFALTADHAGLVIMDATAGNIVANLPAVNVIAQPLRFNFVRADATANTATGNRAGADTFVGGATSFTLVGQGDTATATGDAVSKWALQSLTERFKGANQSLASSGYQKLPGGLILQWGTTAGRGPGITSTVTFPVAFPNAVRSVVITSLFPAANSDAFDERLIGSPTLTGFVSGSGNSSTAGGYYFAIGH